MAKRVAFNRTNDGRLLSAAQSAGASVAGDRVQSTECGSHAVSKPVTSGAKQVPVATRVPALSGGGRVVNNPLRGPLSFSAQRSRTVGKGVSSADILFPLIFFFLAPPGRVRAASGPGIVSVRLDQFYLLSAVIVWVLQCSSTSAIENEFVTQPKRKTQVTGIGLIDT